MYWNILIIIFKINNVSTENSEFERNNSINIDFTKQINVQFNINFYILFNWVIYEFLNLQL